MNTPEAPEIFSHAPSLAERKQKYHVAWGKFTAALEAQVELGSDGKMKLDEQIANRDCDECGC